MNLTPIKRILSKCDRSNRQFAGYCYDNVKTVMLKIINQARDRFVYSHMQVMYIHKIHCVVYVFYVHDTMMRLFGKKSISLAMKSRVAFVENPFSLSRVLSSPRGSFKF